MNINPSDFNTDINDISADDHAELRAVIDADDATRAFDEFDPARDSDEFRDYEADMIPIEFDDDDGFDLTGETGYDPTDDPDPEECYDYEVDDELSYSDGWAEAEAEAYHSQWD